MEQVEGRREEDCTLAAMAGVGKCDVWRPDARRPVVNKAQPDFHRAR